MEGLYSCPPRIEIVDHELHHEVLGVIRAGEQKAARADPKDRDVIGVEDDFEAELCVEAFG